ncbi:MAG: SDR family oxidoreductase [Alphaproteobacteria bacterium]
MDATQDVLEAVFHKKFQPRIFAVRHALGRLCRSIGAVTGQARCKSLPGDAAANSAIEDLARGLARELAPLRVNVVAPGLIATPLMATLPAAVKAAFDARTQAQPVPRMGAPEENADAILWLMGNDYATGAVLEIDGGYKLT